MLDNLTNVPCALALLLLHFFKLARSLQCRERARCWADLKKGNFEMLLTSVPVREAAVSLAGAFITAMLFVTAAVGPLPLV